MRASRHVGPTVDPVELERKLMAEGERMGTGDEEDAGVGGWTFLQKIAVAVAVALIIGYLLLWAQNVQETGGPDGYIRGTAQRGPVDFISTLTGALVLRNGDGPQLYNLETQRDAQNSIFRGYRPSLSTAEILPYNHMPFEALLIAPFMGLPYPIVFALWTLLCGIAVGMSLGLMDGGLPVARPVGWVLSMAACSYLPLIRGLMLGQNSALVLLGLCALYVSLKRQQYGWAGAALVLIALKPQVLPAVLLVLVLQKHWKVLGIFAAMLAGMSIAAMPLLGVGWPLDYARLLVGVAGWSSTGAIDPAIMHNWRGLLTNLFGSSAPGIVTPLFVLFSLLSIGLIVWSWLRSRVGNSDAEPDEELIEDNHSYVPRRDLLWALVGIVAVLTSLHLNPHDLTLLIFPAWIIGAYATSGLWSKGVSRLWVALLAIGYLLAPMTLINPRASVIPSVLLMAVAAVILTWQLATSRAEQSQAMAEVHAGI
ncbi:MAG: glycosyltransferase family 87 protein [Chloroflexota bacterium]